MNYGFVVIGRNEGENLKRCLASLPTRATVVYVDSGSTDGSAQSARDCGAAVIELDQTFPFTAARARNAGFECLKEIAPALAYVQFIDGDSELSETWSGNAALFLNENVLVAAAFGRRSERFPDRSIYNRLCDWEWNGPIGEAKACGGDVMMRISALNAVGGYRDDMIAGEEPELCVRLRGAGWRVWRLDAPMSTHNANMMRFGQWWRRNVRAGYAFAQGTSLHGAPPERHWVWESRRAWVWGVCLPIACATAGILLPGWGWAAWLLYPGQILRQIARNDGSLKDRATLSVFQTLARFPEAAGQINFIIDRLRRRQTRLIEYK